MSCPPNSGLVYLGRVIVLPVVDRTAAGARVVGYNYFYTTRCLAPTAIISDKRNLVDAPVPFAGPLRPEPKAKGGIGQWDTLR